jgi:hypothetical protein
MHAAAELHSISKDSTGEFIVAAAAVAQSVAVLTETGATHAEPTMHTIQARKLFIIEIMTQNHDIRLPLAGSQCANERLLILQASCTGAQYR